MKVCKCPRVEDEDDSDTSFGSEMSLTIDENQVENDHGVGTKGSRNDLKSCDL